MRHQAWQMGVLVLILASPLGRAGEILMSADHEQRYGLLDSGLLINERAWPISDNFSELSAGKDDFVHNVVDRAIEYADLELGQASITFRYGDGHGSRRNEFSADSINGSMIAMLESSEMAPAPIVGATYGGGTAVGMVGIHPILRSLLSEGENLQAMWPFTEVSAKLNYSGFGMRRSLTAQDMSRSNPGLNRPCGLGNSYPATGSVSAQAGMGWGLGSVLFEPKSAVHVRPVQSGMDGWVSPLDDGRYNPQLDDAETPEVQIEMWMLRLRNSLVSSTPFNMACGYMGLPSSGQPSGQQVGWSEAMLTFFLPSCIRQNFDLNVSTTFQPIPHQDVTTYEQAEVARLPPQQQHYIKTSCEVQVCDSSLSALKWHHVLFWQNKRTTMPYILLDSNLGAGWNGSDCMHCRCPDFPSSVQQGQCGRCTHDTRIRPNKLQTLKPESGLVFGGTFNQVAFGAFYFVSVLKKTSPRRLGPQFAPRLPPVDQGHWVIRNTSLEGYFEGRATAYARCDHPGLVAVGTPGGRTWLGSWSGPPWEGTPEQDADRAVVSDMRRRAATAGYGLPLRYRYLPSYLEDARGKFDPDRSGRLDGSESAGDPSKLEEAKQTGFAAGDYAETYRLPWAIPRCVEPWGSESPYREIFHRHGAYAWDKTHEEYAVVTLTLQVDPAQFPPGSPQGDTLANKLRVELVDLIAQIESSRIAVFLERSSELQKRSPPGMLAIVHIYPSNQPAPASGALGEDDDLPVVYDDDAGRITAEGGATVQNSPRIVAYQIIDLFASPSDAVLADTLALAQRYPQDEPRPTLELLPRCKDGSFARICSATWFFSRGFIGLVCFFALSWGTVFLGRCCIDDSGIIPETSAQQKMRLESRETTRSGTKSARDSEASTGGAAAHAASSSNRSESHGPKVNYDDEEDEVTGSSWGSGGHDKPGGRHVLAGYSLDVDEEGGASGGSSGAGKRSEGGIAASGSRISTSSARTGMRQAAVKPPTMPMDQEMPGDYLDSSSGNGVGITGSDSLGGIELPSADSGLPPLTGSLNSSPAQENVLHGGTLSQSGDLGSINSSMWRVAGDSGSTSGGSSQDTANRLIMLRSRPLTRTSNILVPAFGVVSMGCVYLQLIVLVLEKQHPAWITILAALCVFAAENIWYATVRHYILVVEDTSKDARLSKWYAESIANRVTYWVITALSIFFGPTTCMLLQCYWRRWEVFSMPLTMSRNAPEAYPDVLRRHSSIPAITVVGPTFVVITLRVIGVFPPPPPGWPAMVTLAVLFLYFVFTIVSAYLARLDLRLDEQFDADRREMTQGFARYVSEDSNMRSRLSDGTPPQSGSRQMAPDLGPTLPAAQERPMGSGATPPDPLGYGDSEGPPVSESDGAIGETAAVGVRPDDSAEPGYDAPRPGGRRAEHHGHNGRSSAGAAGQSYSTPGLSYAPQSDGTSAYDRSEAAGRSTSGGGGGRQGQGRGREQGQERGRGRVEDDGFMVQQVYTSGSDGRQSEVVGGAGRAGRPAVREDSRDPDEPEI